MHQQKLAKHPKRQRTVQVDQRSMRLQKGLSRQLETLLSNISLCCFLPCVIKISIFSSVDKTIRSFLTPCLAGWFLMLFATMTGRGGTRSPAVWCMQLGKCDPCPARCWQQKLLYLCYCSFLFILSTLLQSRISLTIPPLASLEPCTAGNSQEQRK